MGRRYGCASILRMRADGTPVDALTIWGSGDVGIGTASPYASLEVHRGSGHSGILISTAAEGDTTYLQFKKGGDPKWGMYMPASSQDLHFVDQVGNDVITFQNGGNVGLGTTSPANLLHLYAATDGQGIILDRSSNTTVGTGVSFNTQGAYRWSIAPDNNSTDSLYLYGANTGLVQTWNYTTGYVGIGTPSPAAQLDVQTSGWNSANFGTTDNDAFVTINASGGAGELTFTDDGTWWWDIGKEYNNHFIVYDENNSKYLVDADTSGNLSMGEYYGQLTLPASGSAYLGGGLQIDAWDDNTGIFRRVLLSPSVMAAAKALAPSGTLAATNTGWTSIQQSQPHGD